MKKYNATLNIDNDAHVILLQIRCLTWTIWQTVFVPSRMLSEEARLISDYELFVHIHLPVSLFLPWLFFEGKQSLNTMIQGRLEYYHLLYSLEYHNTSVLIVHFSLMHPALTTLALSWVYITRAYARIVNHG